MYKPILCFYYLTYACNARCQFCDIWRRHPHTAETAKVQQHLRQLKELGVRYIDFTGGEPLLYEDLPQLLETASRMGMHTTITTNCILYPQRAQSLKGLVDFLHFSLDSADSNQHDSLRGAECFNKVMESIETARQLGEKPDILMTVTNKTFNQIEPLWKFVSSKGLMLILNPVFNYTGKDDDLDKEFALKMLQIPYRKFLYNNKAFLKLRLEGGNNTQKTRCRAVSSTVVISPNGNILLPCFHRVKHKVSLLKGISAARNTETFREALVYQGRYSFCRGCNINCYFDPSFLYLPDELFFRSLIAKAKYVYDKFIAD